MKIDSYLHQLWLAFILILMTASLFLPIGEFSNQDGATALLTNFRLNFVEGDSSSAFWALGVIVIVILLITLFELLLSGFRSFTIQKRILIFIGLLLIGYYLAFVAYVLLIKGDASFMPMWGASFPLISLILVIMTFYSIRRAEANIILQASSFRLRD
jgi:hypothetical protein